MTLVPFNSNSTGVMSIVEQELLTLQEHMSALTVFGGVRFVQYLVFLVFCVVFCRSLCVPFSFSLAIESSVFRFTVSDYPYDTEHLGKYHDRSW